MKLIVKGILFWYTLFEIVLWISCIESIINTESMLFILGSLIYTIILIIVCRVFIAEKELKEITFL